MKDRPSSFVGEIVLIASSIRVETLFTGNTRAQNLTFTLDKSASNRVGVLEDDSFQWTAANGVGLTILGSWQLVKHTSHCGVRFLIHRFLCDRFADNALVKPARKDE